MWKLKLDKINFNYPGEEVSALSDISLEIKPSEMILVIGNSGSGKTTFLKMLKESIRPAGEFMGNVETTISDEKIGFVGQDPDNQIVTDKVWHELAFGLENMGLSKSEIRRQVAEMAEYFGIQNWFRKPVNELSGGQKQMLNLASVMVMQPEILLLDEPTAQLSPVASDRFVDMVEKINRELGTTVIITEHRVEKLYPIADKILMLSNGKSAGFDTPLKMAELSKTFYRPLMISSECISTRDLRIWIEEKTEKVNADKLEEANSQIKKKHGKKIFAEKSVTLKNIQFGYEKKGSAVLNCIDLSVGKGEFLACVGGNGSGKTTLLKVIAGLLKPKHGKIETYGKVVLLPQNPMAVFTEVTVEDELADMLESGLSSEKMKEKVYEQLKFMGLENLAKHNPYDLSGGQKQKLALGKALMLNPEILLLDEPTKGIDPEYKCILGKLFKELSGKGMTIIMVSHDLEFCSEYADGAALIFDGEIVHSESAKEFFAGNSFYTTQAARIAGKVLPQAVTIDEILMALNSLEA